MDLAVAPTADEEVFVRRIRLLVADDHALVLEAVRLALEKQPDLAIVRGQRDQGLLEKVRPGLKGPDELALLAGKIAKARATGRQIRNTIPKTR